MFKVFNPSLDTTATFPFSPSILHSTGSGWASGAGFMSLSSKINVLNSSGWEVGAEMRANSEGGLSGAAGARGVWSQGAAGVRGLPGRVLGFGLGDSRPCWVTRIRQGWLRIRAPFLGWKVWWPQHRAGPHCQARRFPPCQLALN